MKPPVGWCSLLVAIGACAQTPAADLLITNAKVYTFRWADPSREGVPAADAPHDASGWRPDAEVVAIRGGSIVYVGSAAGARRLTGPATRVVDVGGATVLPGFVESHGHIAELGGNLARVSLVGVGNEAEAIDRVAVRAAIVPKGEWILGYGWDEGAWANRYPTKAALTARIPDHPVYLRSLHGFAGWGNAMAFERAGITGGTVPPTGGTIIKDSRGEPSGVVLNRAIELFDAAVPAPSVEQLADRIATALDTMAAAGYVAVHEAGADAATMAALDLLRQAGRLTVRVYPMLSARDTGLARRWIAEGPRVDSAGLLSVRAVKAYYDGALGSRGARLLADYADRPGHRGVSGAGYGFDEALVAELMRAGFQVGVHAIGDAGNRETLDFFDRVFREWPATRAGRHRIEHAQVVHPDDQPRFAALGLTASMEPPHAVEDMPWAEGRLGPQRVAGAYAWRTLRRSGAPIIFNSDLPGSDWNLFYGLHAAVTRRDKSLAPAGGWRADERFTAEEAIRAYSGWAARASFTDSVTGILGPGRWADLTVLDIDPLRVADANADQLLGGRVVMTVIAGRIAYRRP